MKSWTTHANKTGKRQHFRRSHYPEFADGMREKPIRQRGIEGQSQATMGILY
jgi:hypothetical protein